MSKKVDYLQHNFLHGPQDDKYECSFLVLIVDLRDQGYFLSKVQDEGGDLCRVFLHRLSHKRTLSSAAKASSTSWEPMHPVPPSTEINVVHRFKKIIIMRK